MELAVGSHGMVWAKWLLERLVASVLLGRPDPNIKNRRGTATARPKGAPRGANSGAWGLDDHGIWYRGSI